MFLMKVFVDEVDSLNHQTKFIALVPPVAGKTVFADVVRSKSADFGFGDFQSTLVVDVFMVSRAKVIDDGHGLSHEVHHVLRVSAHHVVFSEELTDALPENETGVGDGVLVPQDGTDLSGAQARFGEVKNERLHRFFVRVGPFRGVRNVRAGRATLAFSGLVHTCHITTPSGLPTYLPFLITPPSEGVVGS